MDAAFVVRPVDRPHAREEIGHLLRRVGQELGDDFHGLRRHHDRGDDDEVHDEAREALAGAKAVPDKALG